MTFVPISPTVVAQPSAKTQELTEKLVATVREFEQTHPGTRPEEIRQALQLAAGRFAGVPAAAFIAVALGALVFAGFLALYFANRGGVAFSGPAVPMIVIAVLVLGLLGVLVSKKRF